MKKSKKNIALMRRQLDRRLAVWRRPGLKNRPATGWLRSIREALGMTARQYAKRSGIDLKTLLMFEKGEVEDTITLGSLRKLGENLDCELVYALVPRDSLEIMLTKQAEKVARKIMKETSYSMMLEGQDVSSEEREAQVRELAAELKAEMRRILWGEQ